MIKDELDPRLKNALNDLQNVPPRDQQAAQRGRLVFMHQVSEHRQAVSREASRRQNRLSATISSLFRRKDPFPMLNTLIAIILSVVVLFGGSGVTVAAAQGSLPDQALYPIKTWSEDAVLSLTNSSQTRLQYVLNYSDRRVSEITRLLAEGKSIPSGVEARLQNELDMVLELVSGMNDTQAMEQLQLILQRADTQYQAMTSLMSEAPASDAPLLLRAHVRLQEQVQLCAMGESDISGFRMQVRQRFQYRGGSGTPLPGSGQMNSTSMPGSGGSGNGNGNGNGNGGGSGNGPGMNRSTPIPGMNQPSLTPGTNQPAQMPGMSQVASTPVAQCTSTPMLRCTGTPGSGGAPGHTP